MIKRNADKFFGHHLILSGDGTPYMRRMWIGRLRLHVFYRGDNDPDPHDHPWDFWTFPLTPYVEEVVSAPTGLWFSLGEDEGMPEGWDDKPRRFRQVVPAFRWSFRPATHCHRVLGRFSGNAWSRSMGLFVARVSPRGANRDPDLEPYYDFATPEHPSRMITIVWRSKVKRKWGFLKNRDGKWCWQYWREYVLSGGKHGPCE